MSSADDLTGVLTQLTKEDQDVGFRSGKVTEWNSETGQNTIVIAGTPISDVPFLARTEALAIQQGDVVGILRVKSQYFVLGRISTDPGEIIVRDAAGRITVHVRRTPAGGGEIITRHPNGVAHAVLGQLTSTGTGEIVGQGFVVQQSNEFDLIGAGALTPGGPEVVRIGDHLGVRAFATDDGPDGLLDRPYLDVPMWPVFAIPEPWTTTSGTYVKLWLGRLWVTHPGVHVQIRAWCDAGTTGAWGVEVNDIEIAPTQGIPDTGGAAAFYDRGNQLLPEAILANPYSFTKVEIKARRVSGAGGVHVFPYGVTKRGAP